MTILPARRDQKIAALRNAFDQKTVGDIEAIMPSDGQWKQASSTARNISEYLVQPATQNVRLSVLLHWLATIHLDEVDAANTSTETRRSYYVTYMYSFGAAIFQQMETALNVFPDTHLSSWREVAFQPKLTDAAIELNATFEQFLQTIHGRESNSTDVAIDRSFLNTHPTTVPPIMPERKNTEATERPLPKRTAVR